VGSAHDLDKVKAAMTLLKSIVEKPGPAKIERTDAVVARIGCLPRAGSLVHRFRHDNERADPLEALRGKNPGSVHDRNCRYRWP
jgi:hypothetical protein